MKLRNKLQLALVAIFCAFAPLDGAYVMVGNDSRTTAERAVAVTLPITKADGGANSSLTIACPTCNFGAADNWVFTPGHQCVTENNTGWSVAVNGTNDLERAFNVGAARRLVCYFPESFRTASGRGAKLTSVKVYGQILTDTFSTHPATLGQFCAADGAPPTITSIAHTGSLPTAVQANPSLDTLTVTTPAFLNTTACHISLDMTVNPSSGATAYIFYGVYWYYTDA